MPLSGGEDLEQIFCWEASRQVKNDWTIRYKNHYYQFEKSAQVRPKHYVTVRHHLDDSLSIWYKDRRLQATPIEKQRTDPLKTPKKGIDSSAVSRRSTLNRHKTPWGQFNPNWLRPKNQKVNQKDVPLPTESTDLPSV